MNFPDFPTRSFHHLRLVLGPDGLDVAIDAEASNTTIGDVVETDVGKDLGLLLEDKDIVAGGGKIDLGEDLGPLGVLNVAIRAEGTLHRRSRSLVTGEVVGVDIVTADRTGETQLDNAPKCTPLLIPTNFPHTATDTARPSPFLFYLSLSYQS